MDDIKSLITEAKHSTLLCVGISLAASREQFEGILPVLMKWVDCTDRAISGDDSGLREDLAVVIIEPIILCVKALFVELSRLKRNDQPYIVNVVDSMKTLADQDIERIRAQSISSIMKKSALIALYNKIAQQASDQLKAPYRPLKPYEMKGKS